MSADALDSAAVTPAAAPIRAVAPPELTAEEFDVAYSMRPNPERDATTMLKRVASSVWQWVRHDVKLAILFALIGGAVAYVGNVVLIAVHYNGAGKVPSGSPATAPGSEITGSIFWAVIMAMVFALVSFRMRVGKEQFWSGVRGVPATAQRLFRADGNAALEHLLWGAAGTMLVAAALAPAISGMLAIGAALIVVGVLRPLLTGLVMLVWRKLVSLFSPQHAKPPGDAVVSVGMLGAVISLLAAYLVSGAAAKLVIALVAGGAAFLVSRRVVSAPAAVLLLVGVAAPALLALMRVTVTHASDGGWQECGSDFSAWLRCGGGNVLGISMLGGVFGAGGSALGGGVGPALTAEQQRQRALKREMQRWRQDHPCGSWDDFWAGHTETEQGNLLNDMADSMQSEYNSGEMQARLISMFKNAPAGAWHGLQGLVMQMAEMGKDQAQYGLVGGSLKFSYDQMKALYDAIPTLPQKLDQLTAAMASHDPEVSGKIWGELLGQAEFQAVFGRMVSNAIKASRPAAPNFPGSTEGAAALKYAADGTPVAADGLLPLGWREDQIRAGAQVAAQYDGSLALKPGQEAAALRQVGNPLAKPEYLAPKSAEPMDAAVGLGGPNKDGFVQYRLPDPPQAPPGLSGENLASWEQAANAQYAKRMSQYFDNAQSMNKVMKEGATFNVNGQDAHLGVSCIGDGQWVNPVTGAVQKFDNGVIHAIVPADAPPNVQAALGPPGTRVPIPGDSDGFCFVSNARRTADGGIRPISSFPAEEAAAITAQEAAAQQAMIRGGIPGYVHEGQTPTWIPPTPQKAAVKACIMSSVSTDNPAAENLIWIDSKGDTTVGRWPGFTDSPPGYNAPAPGSTSAPPGYNTPAPGGGYPPAPPGYNTPPGAGGNP
ncbi:MAG TPA: hypothetical protein VN193_10260 [Candidatus Angelobacter sp.]|jgi:hypothetical protein|nr:hypothetical protein [Candidatus Angelobacter sp.]